MHLETDPKAASASETTLEFVPPSLLRVRAFLFEHGMPIIPWATAAEVLEDFHELLRSHKSDDAFWQSVHELVLALNIDLRRLQPDHSHDAFLDLAAEQALLAEVRARIDVEQAPSGNFAALTRRLTEACLPALLLLAGAATVSCGARTEYASDPNAGASTGGATGGATSNVASATGGNAGFVVPSTGGNAGFVLPPTTGGSSSGPPVVCATTDAGTGAPISMSDVQNIAQQCIASGSTRDAVLACLSTLNSSWQTGIESMLNCRSCADAAKYLLNMTQSCSNLGNTFQLCTVDPRYCVIPVYMGVRMF